MQVSGGLASHNNPGGFHSQDSNNSSCHSDHGLQSASSGPPGPQPQQPQGPMMGVPQADHVGQNPQQNCTPEKPPPSQMAQKTPTERKRKRKVTAPAAGGGGVGGVGVGGAANPPGMPPDCPPVVAGDQGDVSSSTGSKGSKKGIQDYFNKHPIAPSSPIRQGGNPSLGAPGGGPPGAKSPLPGSGYGGGGVPPGMYPQSPQAQLIASPGPGGPPSSASSTPPEFATLQHLQVILKVIYWSLQKKIKVISKPFSNIKIFLRKRKPIDRNS